MFILSTLVNPENTHRKKKCHTLSYPTERQRHRVPQNCANTIKIVPCEHILFEKNIVNEIKRNSS